MRNGVYCWLAIVYLIVGVPVQADSNKNAVSVAARPVSELAFLPTHRAPASVESLNESRISAEITAVIKEIPVKVGQVVKQDSVLVRLDCVNHELMLQREQAVAKSIQAKLDLADYQLQRAQTLKTKQAVAEELLKQRETELAVLMAEQLSQLAAIQQAQRHVKNCIIRSPFQAIILERIGQVGELASPGSHLLRIMDAQQREVSAKLQHSQIESLKQAVQIMLDVRGKQYPLTLQRITPNIDARERTREVRLIFQDNAQAIPGTAGDITWQSLQKHLPAELIVRRKDQLGIFIVNDAKADFYHLDQASEGRPALVDLSDDTLVITKGRFRLQPNDNIVLN